MEARIKINKMEFGALVLEPETEAEYYAIKHWLSHARNSGLPEHMVEFIKPKWVKD